MKLTTINIAYFLFAMTFSGVNLFKITLELYFRNLYLTRLSVLSDFWFCFTKERRKSID